MIKNPTIIPDTITTRWIAYTTSFDFDLEHIDRERNVLADALTRQGAHSEDCDGESDIEEYLDWIIDEEPAHVNTMFECVEITLPKTEYSQNHQDILNFLKT
ncbi:hypothetical protein HMI56_004193 [Coelomomyces lativittatus]|nr:hypothetical protein HMI56_004193 [Coelomomyces lativittatus]